MVTQGLYYATKVGSLPTHSGSFKGLTLQCDFLCLSMIPQGYEL